MSRSYKKTPRSGEQKNKYFKRYANRRLRRKKFNINLKNKTYKKDFCSYNICDYETVGMTFERFYQQQLKFWYMYRKFYGEPYPTREEAKKDYNRWFKRK